MSMSLDQKKAARFKFLDILYKETEGSEGQLVNMFDIGTSAGLDKDTTADVYRYLNGEGLVEAVALGDRFDDPQNRREVSGHSLLDLRFEYQQGLHRNYFLRLANLTDRRADTFEGFPQAGRTVLVGLEYRF